MLELFPIIWGDFGGDVGGNLRKSEKRKARRCSQTDHFKHLKID